MSGSSCMLFKALGIVNNCGEEPQPDLNALTKDANDKAIAHLMAQREANNVDLADRKRAAFAARKLIATDVVAHTSHVKMNVAKSNQM